MTNRTFHMQSDSRHRNRVVQHRYPMISLVLEIAEDILTKSPMTSNMVEHRPDFLDKCIY